MSPDIDDVVERLRVALVKEARQYGPSDWHNVQTDLGETAASLLLAMRDDAKRYADLYMDRCEKWSELKAENARLREALEEAIEQLELLAKDPKNNALIQSLRAALGDAE